mmetsp:Transcript_6636/g.15899  ORF Transcript_6636/g.15899 Transcript_6636/m.15899 type:complete len:206 (-) Transcript_6636:28-645(-)
MRSKHVVPGLSGHGLHVIRFPCGHGCCIVSLRNHRTNSSSKHVHLFCWIRCLFVVALPGQCEKASKRRRLSNTMLVIVRFLLIISLTKCLLSGKGNLRNLLLRLASLQGFYSHCAGSAFLGAGSLRQGSKNTFCRRHINSSLHPLPFGRLDGILHGKINLARDWQARQGDHLLSRLVCTRSNGAFLIFIAVALIRPQHAGKKQKT